MNDHDPEGTTQEELKEEAQAEPDDPVTRREELEVGLMDEGVSEAGEEIGEEMP